LQKFAKVFANFLQTFANFCKFLEHLFCFILFYMCDRHNIIIVIVWFVAKETEMQEKEIKLMELQEMYETRLLAMKVTW